MERREQTKQRLNRIYSLAAVLLVATAEVAAQEKSSAAAARTRRIVVSISDRKLALVEDGSVLRTYTVAVGAPVSPSPIGEFKVVSRLSRPTYYHPGVVIPPGRNNPLGHTVDRPQPQGLRNSWNQRAVLDWQGGLARLHSHGAGRSRAALRRSARG